MKHHHRSSIMAVGCLGLIAVVGTGCSAGGGGGGGGGTGSSSPQNGTIQADVGEGDQSLAMDSGQTANVTLDASGSSSRNGTITSYVWSDNVCGELATGMFADVALNPGEHNITLEVTDTSGASAQTAFTIMVVDQRLANYAVATGVEGSGTVDPAPGSAESHALNSAITVTATPDPGWQFVSWSGSSDATTAAIDLIVDHPVELTATFQPIPEGGVPRFCLPWYAHETRRTGQANDGSFSHEDRFAWDYTLDIGTPIIAVAAGRVVRIIDDIPNNPEGAEPDPDSQANMIQIDLGAGLQSLYAHLDQFGVSVEPGQRVVKGQFLGRSGNSGFSTGPHLHYEILDASGRSTSTGFEEVVGNDGISLEGSMVTSQTTLKIDSLDQYVESSLPLDAFSQNEITLTGSAPPAFFYETGVPYNVTGRVNDRARNVCVALVDLESGETAVCDVQSVGQDDTFDIDFEFPDGLEGNFLMGIVSGMAGVSGVAPVTVYLSPKTLANAAPTVEVDPPSDDSIDFGETGTLAGLGSDADGDELIYLWAQTSGPPAQIADPSSPSTTFSLGVGSGPTAVRFQLIATDGVSTSKPAEVVFHMLDNFTVTQSGIAAEACSGTEECAAVATTTISAADSFIQVYFELLNGVEDDLSSFEIRDPSGQAVLTGRLCDPLSGSFESIFLRYSWSGFTFESQAGNWAAVYLRNGQDEIAIPFTLAP